MITDAANKFADALLAKMKQYDEYAKLYAVQYAQSDDKAHQATFSKYNELSETFSKLHGEACQFMHAIEAEMQEKLKAEFATDSSKSQ